MRPSTAHRSARRLAAIAELLALLLTWDAVAGSDEESVETLSETALLEQLASRHEVVTEPQGPQLGTYTHDLGAAFGEALRRLFTAWDSRFDDLGGTLARVGAESLIVISAFLLLLLLSRWAWRLWRRRHPSSRQAISAVSPHPERSRRGAEDWAQHIEQELAAGRLAAALAALWWWLASHLAPTAEASWTSRELVIHGGRPDLLPQVRQLDRLIYGAGMPQAVEIRGLWQTLREKLG